MNSSKFFSSLGLLIFLNGVIKPLWIFGVDRQVQNTLGAEEYGTYFSLFNLSIVLSFILDLGLSTFLNRQLAAREGNFSKHLGGFLLLKLILALIYIGIILFIAWLAGVKRWDILWCVILIQMFSFLFVFFRSIITAQQWFSTDAGLSVFDKVAMIIVCSCFLVLPGIFGVVSIQKFLVAQVACTAFAMVMAIIVLLNNGIRFKRPNLSFLNLGILKECLPFAVIFLLASIHMRLDGFLLERMHPSGAHEAGIYASGYRLLDASRMVSFLMGSFLLPYIARRWSQGLGLTDVILNSRHMLMMLSIPILAITMVLAPWIQTSLYHQSDSEAAGTLRWSMAGLIGYSLIQLYGTVMIATGYIKQFCYFTLLSIGLNLLFNFFLIPLYGAKGCGIAAFISQEFCAAAVILFVRYKLKISINIRSLAIYSFTGMSILMFLLIGNQLNLNSLLLIILVPFITLSIVFTSNLFPIQSWIRWIKNRKLAEATAR